MNNSESKLLVRIGSFSFKKGLPQDSTEHGGGFIFDCRCLLNPGREQSFKMLTGRDEPVIAFLEARADAQEFWSHVQPLIARSVEHYLSRNFTYLSVQFGCTGGQHRSVFFAEKTAQLLSTVSGVVVELTHRDMPR